MSSSNKSEGNVDESRRSAMKIAVSAIVAGAVAGVGGYYAGGMGAAPAATVERTVTKTVAAETVTKTAPAETVTKTVEKTVTPTPKAEMPVKEEIVWGHSTSLTGELAESVAYNEEGRKMWFDQCNEHGGLFVEEYGARIPVRKVVYDDRAIPDEMLKLYERLITVDKVDALTYAYGTWMSAMSPLLDKYHMPVVAGTALPVEELESKYLFFNACRTPTWAKANAEAMELVGATTAYVFQLDVLFGVEYWKYFESEFNKRGLEVVGRETHPLGVPDLTGPIMEVKRLIDAGRCDATFLLGYPPGQIVYQRQLIELNVNPKMVYGAFNVFAPSTVDMFGWANMDTVCGFGQPCIPTETRWRGMYSNPKEWFEEYVKRYGRWPDYTQSLNDYQSLEVQAQAIQMAGTLDGDAVQEVLASGAQIANVNGGTIYSDPPDRGEWMDLGPIGINNLNIHPIGGIGTQNQWQLKEGAKPEENWYACHVISPKRLATAEPIYPKKPWVL